MEIQELKEYIYENNYIPIILESIGCTKICFHDSYWSCCNPDGDNPTAINVYNNSSLIVNDYTRDISSQNRSATDIFDLVCFFEKINLFESIKNICEWIGIDYYHDFDEELPESIKLTKFLLEMSEENEVENDNYPLKPINESIINYYPKRVNDLFYNDGIDYITQNEFEIGYDILSNRITIPIRDELGNLVGVKGRIFSKDINKNDNKYISIERYSKGKVLYGLYKTLPYITREKKVYVAESEKAVMQLWSAGIYNVVATGGKKITSSQIEKLTRLCSDIIFMYDKDVLLDEIKLISERFIDEVNIYAIIDKDGLLDDKESPSDNIEKFNILTENNIYRIK